MRSRRLAWPVLLPMLFVAPADESTQYYDVTGMTADALRGALNRLRPTMSTGERHDAMTSWDIQWRYQYDRVAGGCAVTTANVVLTLVVTLPRWADEQKGSPELVKKWRAFHAALVTHEAGHASFARAARDSIERTFYNYPPQPTCDRIDAVLDVVGRLVLNQYKVEQFAYDAATEHGIRQGAKFP